MAFRQEALPGSAYVNERNSGHCYAVPGRVGWLCDTSSQDLGLSQGGIPVEWGATAALGGSASTSGTVIPLEWRNSPGGDLGGGGGGVPIGGRAMAGIPVEWLTQYRGGGGGGGVPIGGLAGSGIPVEWRAGAGAGGGVTSGPISYIPVEWLATATVRSTTTNAILTGYPLVPFDLYQERIHRRLIGEMVNRLNRGHFAACLDVTLNANTGATLIRDNRIGHSSGIGPMMAMSRSAAAAIAAGIWFEPAQAAAGATTASIVAHHNNTPETDKTIRFGILG